MSLGEIQQIYDLLVRIDQLLSHVDGTSDKINRDLPRISNTLTTFRQLERLALRWLVLAQKMGLPPQITQAANIMARFTVIIRMAQMSINLMMMTNPVTALIGVAGILGTAASAVGMLEGY